jgi:hypothetical protein
MQSTLGMTVLKFITRWGLCSVFRGGDGDREGVGAGPYIGLFFAVHIF